MNTDVRTAMSWRTAVRATFSAVVVCVLAGLPARGATIINLNDGRTIVGEIVSLQDGMYTIRSTTQGTLRVPAADVHSLSSESPPEAARSHDAAPSQESAAPAPTAPPPDLERISERLRDDPRTMDAIRGLQDNPAVQDVLNDKEIMDAIRSGNLSQLLGNPKIARLADDPQIRALTQDAAPRADGSGH